MQKPDFIVVQLDGKPTVKIQCPQCGIWAYADDDQFHGRVSLSCPRCDYHERHDLAAEFKEQEGGG